MKPSPSYYQSVRLYYILVVGSVPVEVARHRPRLLLR